MTTRRFTFQDDSSNKFWEIELAENSFNVRFGRVGSDGQSQTKTFASAADTKKQYDKLVAEKTKKGYVEEKLNAMSAKASSNKVAKTSTPATASKTSSPKTESVSAKSAKANTVSTGQIALNELAEAVARSDAKTIASMFDGVSEAERARVRAALLEIHGIFGWNESAIKPAALKKYTPEECQKKCANNFECFVVVAIGGPRDDLMYAKSRVSHLWKKEVNQLLRGRPVDWLRKLLSEDSEIEEWRELVDAGVIPQELDDLSVRSLLNGFYQDASATVLKSVYKSYPWISDVVYRIYSFENWVVNASNFADRLSCLYAFIEFLSDKKILDRKKLVGCVLNGIHQVPKTKHVGACILILEYLEPTVEELIAHQGALCSALTLGTPNGQDYLLRQLELCTQEKKFDSVSGATAIATIMPQVSLAVAKQALKVLTALSQTDSSQTSVLSAMAQSLLHTKREIAELGLKTLQSNFSNQAPEVIQAVNQVLSHCSQVVKKQVNDWLASPPQQPSNKQVATPTKSKASTKTKRPSSASAKEIPSSEPLQRSPELIKTFRDSIPSLAISPLVDCHLWRSNYHKAERGVSTRDLYHKLIATHFGLPYFETATAIQKKINSNFAIMQGSKESSWWEVWSNSLTAAVALGEEKQAQQIAEWFSFGRRETSYDFQKPSPGICYLTVLLANRLRTKKLEPNKAMQSAMIRDKNAKVWLSAYQALESNDEDEFLKLFSKAAVKHIRQFESDIKAGKHYRTDAVSEIGTLLWHAGKEQGLDVQRLGKESMAVIMTKDSLVPNGKPDPRDQLRLPVAKDRITQSLKTLLTLLNDCEIPFAITTPVSDDNDLKIYRWQLVADMSAESFERLYQAHDPFQFCLNRKILDAQRDFEMPLLIDMKNGVVMNHLQLSKVATQEALSRAMSVKQHGVAIPSCCVEHVVALAGPVVDRLRKELAASTGKLLNRFHDCTRCADYCERVIKMTADKSFDWRIAEQLASRIPSAKGALAAIQRGENVPPRFKSLLRMARD